MKIKESYNSIDQTANFDLKNFQMNVLSYTITGVIIGSVVFGISHFILQDIDQQVFTVLLGAVFLFLISLLLNIKGFSKQATVLCTMTLAACILISTAINPGKTENFYILVIPLIIANLTIKSRTLLLLSFLNSAVIVLFSVLFQEFTLQSVVNPVIFINTATILIIIGRRYREWLEKQRENTLIETRNATIYAVAFQAEMRDHTTGSHLERTSKYVSMLAHALMNDKKYSSYITDEYIKDLTQASILHDIGKVGVPDSILLKPSKLTDDEFEQIKNHCIMGKQIIEEALQRLHSRTVFDLAEQVVLSHHERWDGKGYPEGLSGSDIPLSARIMALADVYDALRTIRPYKSSMNHEKSRDIIISGKGTHFDPALVDAFISIEHNFHQISDTLFDGNKMN